MGVLCILAIKVINTLQPRRWWEFGGYSVNENSCCSGSFVCEGLKEAENTQKREERRGEEKMQSLLARRADTLRGCMGVLK